MVLEVLISDMGAHFGSGFALSAVDWGISKSSSQSENRVSAKKNALSSIDIILDADARGRPVAQVETVGKDAAPTTAIVEGDVPGTVSKESFQYAQNVYAVRDYLMQKGIIKNEQSGLKKFMSYLRNVTKEERLNSLSNKALWAPAIALEVVWDSILGVGYYTHILGESQLGSFWHNIYQIPAFWAGMVTGKQVTKAINLLTISKEERQLTKALDAAVKQTPIVDIVLSYQPTPQVEQEMERRGIRGYAAQLTGAGASLTKAITKLPGKAYEGIRAYRESRAQEDAKARQELTDRFNDITKGR